MIKKEILHYIKGLDGRQMPVYFFVKLKDARYFSFIEKLRACQPVDVREIGDIIFSGYGKVSGKHLRKIKENYTVARITR